MKKNVVILPYSDLNLKDDIEYTFGKVIVIYHDSNINEIIEKIDTMKLDNIILINFNELYRQLLLKIDKKYKVKAIITHNIAGFTNIWLLNIFQNVMEYYDRGLYSSIGCFDKELSSLLEKRGYNAYNVYLDTKITFKSKENSNSVGIICDDFDPNHNFYNALCGAKLAGVKQVKFERSMYETQRFTKIFDINEKICQSEKETCSNNTINVFVAFTNYVNTVILSSFDSGIPCIIGNNSIFDNYPILKENCVLKSDDNISELAQKIINVKREKDKILNEYKTFRKDYNRIIKINNSNF